MKSLVQSYLHSIDFDIRKTGNARFFDQKVQPDVLCAVCECILTCIDDNDEFTINDVRYCDYSNELVTEIFNKPEVKKAKNEYDKFFSQPIKMLAYCRLLSENTDNRPYTYKVVNKEIIEYLSLRDRNAFYFLVNYLEKVFKDSNLWESFQKYFKVQDIDSLYELRNEYVAFIKEYTPIKKDFEPIRIFNPMLNTLCFSLKKLGSKKGKVAKINYNDLLYNRPNWRDVKKDKSVTREEFNETFLQDGVDNKKSYLYYIDKAKRFVKSIHPNSEIHRFDAYPATQAHHIFLSHKFPELADVTENIIAVTPNQHFQRAHPNNNTSLIDKSYQAICLISKLDTIEMDYRNGTGNYSKENFINVLNVGLDKDFDNTTDFEELKHNIIQYFITS